MLGDVLRPPPEGGRRRVLGIEPSTSSRALGSTWEHLASRLKADAPGQGGFGNATSPPSAVSSRMSTGVPLASRRTRPRALPL